MNRSFGGTLDCNNINYNKGKSFRFSEWNSSTLFSNDDYIQDFVSYMGSMYACIQTNTGVEPTNELYWKLVVSGQQGVQGKQGKTGVTFTPHVDSQGNLSWTNDGGLENPVTVNIKGQKGDTGKDSIVPGPQGESITGPVGPRGKQGEQGVGLEFNWDGTKLGIKRTVDDEYTYVDLKGTTGSRGLRGLTGNTGPEGPIGPKGDSLYIQVSEPNEFGQRFLQKRYSENEAWVSFFDLSQMRGPKGDSIIVERNTETGNIEYRYQNQPSTANKVLIYKDDIKGPKGDTIARTYVADDGYLYIQLSGEDLPRRVGYVRGDRGEDGREIILRVYTGPSEDPDDTRIGTHLQWKYAGDEYKLWTNLIQINDLMNVALAGLKLEYKEIEETDVSGEKTKYEVIELSHYQVEFDENNNLILTKKIANLSSVKVPTKTLLKNVKYDNGSHSFEFIFDTANGEQTLLVSIADLVKEFDEKLQNLKDEHDADIKTLNETIITVNQNLVTSINTINKNMIDGFNTINGGINNEIRPAIAKNAEDIVKLREDLTTETSERKEDVKVINDTIDNELRPNITKNAENIESLRENLEQETTDRKAADNVLQSNIDSEAKTREESDTKLQENIDAEIERATNAEQVLQENIDNETTRAQEAEQTLQTNITAETVRAQNAEKTLQSNIDAETERATAKETELQTNIDAEVTRAKAAESQLQTNLDTESARAKAAEEALVNKTDELNQDLIDTQNNLAAEIIRATNAESEIYDHIHEVEGKVDSKVDKSEKGQPNGVATLDENGFIPSTQINGQMAHVFGVDGVATASTLPTLTNTDIGDIYWTTDTKKFYNWNGLSWDEPMDPKDDTIYNFRNCDATGDTSRTNILYRWDGQELTEISESLALGEVTGTAYEGSKGAANRAAINSTPSQIISTVNVSTDASKVNINLETATKSGLNYGSVTQSVKSIPAATSTSAGVITSAQYTSLTDTIPNKLAEIEETLEGKQDSGDYVTSTELEAKNYLTEELAVETYQPIGDYATKTELSEGLAGKQNAGDYALKSEIPTKVSELTNDSGFITESDLPTYKTINSEEITGTGDIKTIGRPGIGEDSVILNNYDNVTASGKWSLAHGGSLEWLGNTVTTEATDEGAVALGIAAKALSRGSVAMGVKVTAGQATEDDAEANIAFGYRTFAYGGSAFAVGGKMVNSPETRALGYGAVALGASNTAMKGISVGQGTLSIGNASHAEGYGVVYFSDQVNIISIDSSTKSFVISGDFTAEDITNLFGASAKYISTESKIILDTKLYTVASVEVIDGNTKVTVNEELNYTEIPKYYGIYNKGIAAATASHVEGGGNYVYDEAVASHAEGVNNKIYSTYSHAEGIRNVINNGATISHAEGNNNQIDGELCHAEGNGNIVAGQIAHAEGNQTQAIGNGSHSEGQGTKANGTVSHTEGNFTIANNKAEHAQGQYNVSNTGEETSQKTIHSIGIGTAEDVRTNAQEVMLNGDYYIYGIGGYIGNNYSSSQTLQKVISKIQSDIPSNISELNNDSGFITNSALSAYALKSEIPDISNLATKSELSGYLPLTGGTLEGDLHVDFVYIDRIYSADGSWLQFDNNTGVILFKDNVGKNLAFANHTHTKSQITDFDDADYATAAQGIKADSALQKADIATGTTNGTILVDGSAVAVKGLGSAAYTASSAYDAAGTAASQASSALSQAKTYADSLWVWSEFE